jgi:nucleotide-binding universal stress UspA family protein
MRTESPGGEMFRIVVGVDGSEASQRALRWAVEEAVLRNGAVKAVYIIPQPHPRSSADLASLPEGTRRVSPEDAEREAGRRVATDLERAHRFLSDFANQALLEVTGPEPQLEVLPHDHPAEALIHRSRDADLLVIGTRGLGGFAGVLLGSVAHHCIQHAQCPILIVRPQN